MPSSETSARTLGWFSLGLGTAQLLAPGTVARCIGVGSGDLSRTILRLVGARELLAGVGLLTQRRPTVWLWARVAGDLLDLGLLGAALTTKPRRPDRLALAFGATSGVAAADLSVAKATPAPQPVQHTKAITIARPPEEVARLWRSLPEARDHAASVRFAPAPGNRGTEVRVEITHDVPGGSLGATVARLFGQAPQQHVQADLRRLKKVLETGEVVRSEATLDGAHLFQRPARPPTADELTGAPA